jgi:type II secretory pathway component PulC
VGATGAERVGAILSRAPSVQADQQIGLKLKSGGTATQALGFESGDVIVDIEPAAGQDGAVAQSFGAQDLLNVTFVRNGVPHSVSIEGAQLANLRTLIE